MNIINENPHELIDNPEENVNISTPVKFPKHSQRIKYVTRGIFIGLFSIFTALSVYLIPKTINIRPKATSITTLSISPQEVSVTPQQTFTVQVVLDTKDQTVSGVALKLNFDSTKVIPVSIVGGPFLPVVLAGGTITGSNAEITVGSSPTEPKKGSGSIAIITCKAVGETGTSQITFNNATVITAIGQTTNVADEMISATVNFPSPSPTPEASPSLPPSSSPTPLPTLSPSPTPETNPTPTPGTTPTPTPTPELQKCNITCNPNVEHTGCTDGLVCEPIGRRCRKSACTSREDCTCPITTPTPTPTPQLAQRITPPKPSLAPTPKPTIKAKVQTTPRPSPSTTAKVTTPVQNELEATEQKSTKSVIDEFFNFIGKLVRCKILMQCSDINE